MSRFSGRQSTEPKLGAKNKGILRAYKDKKYEEAVERQLATIEQGSYMKKVNNPYVSGVEVVCFPKPIEGFLRKGDVLLYGRPYTPPKEVDNGH